MSLNTSIHLKAGAHLVGEPSSGDHGYVRIQTQGPDSYRNCLAIHGDGPELRRLAAACLNLADDLDTIARAIEEAR